METEGARVTNSGVVKECSCVIPAVEIDGARVTNSGASKPCSWVRRLSPTVGVPVVLATGVSNVYSERLTSEVRYGSDPFSPVIKDLLTSLEEELSYCE